MTSPWYAVGTVTSSRETGSSSTGLAVAAGLLLVLPLGVGLACDGLAVWHPELLGVDLHAELAGQPLGDDGQVRFTHARQQRLPRLVVTAHAQRGILVLQTVQARHELVLVALRLRLDGDREHGRRGFDERHR